MKQEDLDKIESVVECEGFDYAFTGYSSFSEVKDDEFQRLRKAFLEARKKLIEYLKLEEHH